MPQEKGEEEDLPLPESASEETTGVIFEEKLKA